MKFNLQSQDIWAGLFFIAFGAFSLQLIANYPMGTLVRMGPGFFPAIIAWATIVLGTLITFRGLRPDCEGIDELQLRPLLFITAALVAFGLLVDRAGLLIATAALIALSRCGGAHYRRVGEITLQYIILVAAVTALFLWALDLPIRIWPVWRES